VNADEIRSAKPYDFDGELILYVGRLERYKIYSALWKLSLTCQAILVFYRG